MRIHYNLWTICKETMLIIPASISVSLHFCQEWSVCGVEVSFNGVVSAYLNSFSALAWPALFAFLCLDLFALMSVHKRRVSIQPQKHGLGVNRLCCRAGKRCRNARFQTERILSWSICANNLVFLIKMFNINMI